MIHCFPRDGPIVYCGGWHVAEKLYSICVRHGFRWTSDVTFSDYKGDYMYKFAYMYKLVLNTFSINCVIKDLGLCQSTELYFVADIYQSDRLTSSIKIVRNNLQLKMIKSTNWGPPPLTSTFYYKCILVMSQKVYHSFKKWII